MDMPEHSEPIEELPTPTPAAPSSRRSALVGALVGMTALAGTIVGVGAIAGAQDGPRPESTIEPAAEDTSEDPGEHDVDADFEAFEACMAEHLGDLWLEPEIIFEGELAENDEVVEEIGVLPFDPGDEQKFIDAEAACADLLPEEIQAEMAAWDAFDDCLREAGVFDEGFDLASSVHIETGDGFQIAEFGDTEGSVTITGTAGDLTVTATGGVTLLDEAALDAEWDAFDDAHEACEALLPDLGEFDEFDEFEESDD